ncbi:uncharacterized protein YbbK (DUF523 family) [Bacilli bacterium PM5-9]|nr:uncharacterized protein YbbK (DUF523 family) [Bacilli bacterium PM5-9]
MKKAASACLCGIKCRYNGLSITNLNENEVCFLPICPEILAGLPSPRNPIEIKGKINDNAYDDLLAKRVKVVDKEGNDYSDKIIEGVNKALQVIIDNEIELVVLKDCSPTCGCGIIYDGTFSSKKVKGNGIFCDLLSKKGVKTDKYM